MRARLAILSSGHRVELREILLRDKPKAFLETSPSATVPALRLDDTVLDESLDIMLWALKQHDPEGLLRMPSTGWDLIKANDGPFKQALDRTKYATRYPEHDPDTERAKASEFMRRLDTQIGDNTWLFGHAPTVADIALLPFIRQFAYIDRSWFDAQPWPHLRGWLDRFLESPAFAQIMQKYPLWSEGADPILFGHSNAAPHAPG